MRALWGWPAKRVKPQATPASAISPTSPAAVAGYTTVPGSIVSAAATPRMNAKDRRMPGTVSSASISYSRFTCPR